MAPERNQAQPARPRLLTSDDIRRLDRRLSDRDRQVLSSLQLHQYLTTRQLQRFHFTDFDSDPGAARICRRSLARLHQLGVIEHLDRQVGGMHAGSAAYIWRIGLAGDRLLRSRQPDRLRSRRKEPSLRFLDHRLDVAQTHLRLRDVMASLGGELVSVQGEPACWRSFLRPSGARDILKPDLYAVTALGDFEDHWFLEIDRDTESLPTLIKKCAQYLNYRASGQEQHRLGISPKVVWVVPDQARADKLAEAISKSKQLPAELFRIGTQDELQRIIERGAE